MFHRQLLQLLNLRMFCILAWDQGPRAALHGLQYIEFLLSTRGKHYCRKDFELILYNCLHNLRAWWFLVYWPHMHVRAVCSRFRVTIGLYFTLLSLLTFFVCRILHSSGRGEVETIIKICHTTSGVRQFNSNLMWSQCLSFRSRLCWAELMEADSWPMPSISICAVSKKAYFIYAISITTVIAVCVSGFVLISDWSSLTYCIAMHGLFVLPEKVFLLPSIIWGEFSYMFFFFLNQFKSLVNFRKLRTNFQWKMYIS